MNKFQILNELQRCMEKSSTGNIKDIWFRGVYLGRIVKFHGTYSCFYQDDHAETKLVHEACYPNFSAAIGSYVEYAVREELWQQKEALKFKQPELKSLGKSKPSIWQKIKWWFSDLS